MYLLIIVIDRQPVARPLPFVRLVSLIPPHPLSRRLKEEESIDNLLKTIKLNP